MSEQQKEQLLKVGNIFGINPGDRTSLISTIGIKTFSLVLAILFWVLRGKACAAGKVGKKRLFTVLAVMFTINIFTSRVIIGGEGEGEEDEFAAFEDDFEDEM